MKINSRAKGAAAERQLIIELREHLGDEIAGQMKRNLEQSRKGGHDIAGLDGWALEVKRYKSFTETELARIWERQVIDQAWKINARPALAYKGDYKPWRFRVPIALLRDHDSPWGEGVDWLPMWTADIGIEAFSSLVREAHCAAMLRGVANPGDNRAMSIDPAVAPR